MNQFIFCLWTGSRIIYGLLQANDGRTANDMIRERFKDSSIDKLEIKGIASKSWDYDIVEINE